MRKTFTLSLLLLLTVVANSQMQYLRGQLNAGQVSTVVTSPATGIVIIKYNPTTKLLQHMGNYRGLTAPVTEAHIHTGAFNEDGPTVVTLTASGGTDGTLTGSQVLTAAQEADLLAGRLYTDVHTTAYPGGEIRTQLIATTSGQSEFLSARLQGAQADPPNGSTASGLVNVLIDKSTKRLYLTGSFTGLTTPAVNSEIHQGAPNTSGPPVHTLVFSTSTTGTLNALKALTDTDLNRLLSGNVYVDIHNDTYPSGEIRGQLTKYNQLNYFVGSLSGTQEIPANSSTARGTVIVRYNTETNLLELTGDYQNLSATVSGSHIHGPATTIANAPVLYPVTNSGGTMGTLTLSTTITDAEEGYLLNGNLYVNVHSAGTYAAGEIRAQLIPTTVGESQYITGAMSASQSVATPAVVSDGVGNATVLLDRATRNIFVTGSYSGLTSVIINSHIHRGAAGTNGPVSIPLQFVAGTTSGTITGSAIGISVGLSDSITNGFSYLNIHTANYPAGEIRAQLGSLVLPVQLSYFNGFKDRNSVALIWESAQELNVKNYQIEQQNDAVEWIEKGTVVATGGNTPAKYRFDDIPTNTKKEFVLYRLKTVDQQGMVSYSSIIRINFQQSKAVLTLLSNPVVNGKLGFTLTGISNSLNQKAEISIIDFGGRVMNKSIGSTLQTNFVDITDLSRGMYKVVVRTNNATFQQSFSKQ